ncbi:MAG: serine acetyltransferase [Spirochaetota bacterium]|jgi:serine O-acetyltransferase|nr:serine acetyltransferase [Spirochaetota bacterium]
MDNLTSTIEQVLAGLVRSYQQGGANGINGKLIPSRESIITVLRALQSLIFPGFYENEIIDMRTIRSITGQQLYFIARRLSEEIEKGICHNCDEEGTCNKHDHCRDKAQAITERLLTKLPEVRETILKDVEAIYAGDPAAKSHSEVILAYPGLAAITAYRIAHILVRENVPLIPRMMMEHIHHETGIDIHPGASIGERLVIDHGTGIVIGETAVIGNDVKLYHGVTLGAFAVTKEATNRKRHPTICDEVTIYAGATILGGDTVIGKGSVVGANVWLTHSVEPWSRIK